MPTDLFKARKLKILMYAQHHPFSSRTRYVGGAWIRLLAFLKRARAFNLGYVLVEPLPKFKDVHRLDYESVPIHSHEYNKILGTVSVILEATVKGVRRALKRDIDLIVSPIETPHATISAFATSFVTRIPWTLIAHNAPVYSRLVERHRETSSPSFKDLYRYLRYAKYRGGRIHQAVFSAMLNYILYKVLRTTVIIGISNAVSHLRRIDKNIRVKAVFPANGIPAGARAEAKRPAERKEYDALFVGSLLPEKGIMDAIQVWAIVTKKNPSLKLYLIGRAKEQRMVKSIESLVDRNNLQDNIHFLCDPLRGASLQTVYESMKKSKILIFPSIMDTWPIVVGEALTFGLPVVAYDVPALRRAYADCEALIRVPKDSIDQLATETKGLLENPLSLSKLSKEASQYAENYHSWSQVILAERSLYEELCLK